MDCLLVFSSLSGAIGGATAHNPLKKKQANPSINLPFIQLIAGLRAPAAINEFMKEELTALPLSSLGPRFIHSHFIAAFAPFF